MKTENDVSSNVNGCINKNNFQSDFHPGVLANPHIYDKPDFDKESISDYQTDKSKSENQAEPEIKDYEFSPEVSRPKKKKGQNNFCR
ncbi:MAG: hypothetical protein LUG95_00470 [Clostridiales bacterium]|nr:hypothetical protein [Clostridiales bacterium]